MAKNEWATGVVIHNRTYRGPISLHLFHDWLGAHPVDTPGFAGGKQPTKSHGLWKHKAFKDKKNCHNPVTGWWLPQVERVTWKKKHGIALYVYPPSFIRCQLHFLSDWLLISRCLGKLAPFLNLNDQGIWGGGPLPPFGVTSAEIIITCPEMSTEHIPITSLDEEDRDRDRSECAMMTWIRRQESCSFTPLPSTLQ